MLVHDLIGIGFGPSNIALAIALDEKHQAGHPIQALFIERQTQFSWHPGMLLDHAHMQISFMKDLVTLRNPTSRYTFINYLHEKNRLPDFINLKTAYPSRHEFNDYLNWAATQFENQCVYGEEVLEVRPHGQSDHHEVRTLQVRSRNTRGQVRERLTRNLVVSLGGAPRIPPAFQALEGDSRILHSNTYLRDIPRCLPANKVAVIGAGQSAAEIFMDLQGRPDVKQIDLIMRAQSIKPSDDSPFVNEIFNADFVDKLYPLTETQRRALLQEFRHTNYACPDSALIEQIYQVFYMQQIRHHTHHRFLRCHQVQSVQASPEGIRLCLLDGQTGHEINPCYDAVVLATGYERQHHKDLLSPLAPFLGDFKVQRNYRVHSSANFHPAIFLQGACEHTHGLSDTLLSITAIRTGEICEALLSSRPVRPPEPVEV